MDDTSSSSSHLLLHPNSSPENPEQRQGLSLDDTIDRCVDISSRRQFLQVLLISFAWVFDAQQTFINVFTDAQPSWHCTAAACSAETSTAPCNLPIGSWTWDQPKHSSIISDWSLECSSPFIRGLPTSAYFAGCLAGSLLLSSLADSSLGRKTMLFLSSLTISLSGLFAAASPNLWVYIIIRFIIGFGRSTIGSNAIVLASEIVSRRWRGEGSVVGYFFFTFGFLSLPAMAYIGRACSWRYLYLSTAIPSFCYSVLIYFFVNESPRWLFVRGRVKEAILILKSSSSPNQDFSDSIYSHLIVENQTPSSMDMYSTLKTIFERRWARRRLIPAGILGFGSGMAYYGLPLGVGSLNFNLYLSVAFNALAELLAAVITLLFISKMDRRLSILGFSMASAAGSILCVVWKDKVIRTAAEVVAFFAAVMAFNVLLIYCLELFPTRVRNSALSMARLAVMIGCGVAPMLVVAGGAEGAWSYGVFGVIIGGCGVFASFLPETRGRRVCDTMEEEEHMENLSKNQLGLSS